MLPKIKNRWRVIYLLIVLMAPLPLWANIPEPDAIVYGTITLGATPITATDTQVMVFAKLNNYTLASYRMGTNGAIGDRYLLSIPVESLGDRNPYKARFGDLISIVVNGITVNEFLVGSRGRVAELSLQISDTDTDGDGISDAFENLYGLNPYNASDAALDSDGDGLANLEEFRNGTNPLMVDTDADGMPDGFEIAHSLNPLNALDAVADPDGDGYSNLEEYQNGTDPGTKEAQITITLTERLQIQTTLLSLKSIDTDGFKIAAIGSTEPKITFWDYTTGLKIKELPSNSRNGLNAIRLNSSQALVASADGVVEVYNFTTEQLEKTLTVDRSEVLSLALYQNHLLAGSAEGLLKAWALSDFSEAASWSAGGGSINAIEGSSANTLFTLQNFPTRAIALWNWTDKSLLSQIAGTNPCCAEGTMVLNGEDLQLSSFELADSLSALASGAVSPSILAQNTGTITTMVLLNDYLITGDTQGMLRVRMRNSGTLLYSKAGHAAPIRQLVVYNQALLSAAADGQIKAWDFSSNQN